MPKMYGWFNRPPAEDCMEHPDPTNLLETTGYERIEKTVHRLMRAGVNLYMKNRNMDDDELYSVQHGPVSMSKFADAKDVNMYMREIQKRLKRKARRDPDIIDKPEEKPEVVEKPEAK